MREKTLVILAGGMGSRFGGLKQIEPVGPNGEFIIDYSIYSAIKYGFNKVVFVIKEENYEIFKETIGSRVSGKIKVEYAFQRIEDIPDGFSVPEGRVKPWGTAHAVYAARDFLHDNFAIINADDFYGDKPFELVSKHLSEKNEYLVVGYKVGGTLSPNGAVKRGVILFDDSKVTRIIESKIMQIDGKASCIPLDQNIEPFEVELDHPVSMLIIGFTPEILTTIGGEMKTAFENNKDHLEDFEMLIPDVLDKEITKGKNVEYITTDATWMGVTYKEDLENLKAHVLSEIDKEIYPANLWE